MHTAPPTRLLAEIQSSPLYREIAALNARLDGEARTHGIDRRFQRPVKAAPRPCYTTPLASPAATKANRAALAQMVADARADGSPAVIAAAKARIQAAISFLDSPDTAREPAHLRGITAIDLTGALHDLEAA